jgi:acyl-CoA synthetase (AMP-forming)/AMP-acid ligase II
MQRIGAHLAGHGIRPSNRVAVWLPSRVETAIALLACSRNGYMCCPSLQSRRRTLLALSRAYPSPAAKRSRFGQSDIDAPATYGAYFF